MYSHWYTTVFTNPDLLRGHSKNIYVMVARYDFIDYEIIIYLVLHENVHGRQ